MSPLMESEENKLKILMLPWLAHGHISPFLEIAKRLSQRSFQVSLCSTTVNLQPLRQNQILTENDHISSIDFIDIPLDSSPELPPEFHTTKNLPPHLMSSLKTAFDGAKETFRQILRTHRPDILVYDFIQPWAAAVAHEENISSVLFLSCGAATCSFLVHYSQYPESDIPFSEFIFPRSYHERVLGFMDNVANGIRDGDRFLECISQSSGFILIKTLEEVESKYFGYLSKLVRKEVIPVGPLIQAPTDSSDDSRIMEWLNKREPSSVVFVSFGTEYFLSEKEVEEIACGLEMSKVSFIWVLRFPGGKEISVEEALPQKFLKSVEDRGIVVEGWAPQAKILKHSNIGGFVSHCGWSSTMEAIVHGVPIIAVPMHLDQPLNAKIVVELGIGLEVQRQNEILKGEELADVIKKVVLEEDGKETRKRVEKLGEKIRQRGDKEMDIVVEKIKQLVKGSQSCSD